MFAIIETGGKQYTVRQGNKIAVERLDGEIGDAITLDRVLATASTVGAPLVEGASVSATVIDQKRDKKIIVFKKKRRQNYRRKNGHRQHQTVLEITDIAAGA